MLDIQTRSSMAAKLPMDYFQMPPSSSKARLLHAAPLTSRSRVLVLSPQPKKQPPRLPRMSCLMANHPRHRMKRHWSVNLIPARLAVALVAMLPCRQPSPNSESCYFYQGNFRDDDAQQRLYTIHAAVSIVLFLGRWLMTISQPTLPLRQQHASRLIYLEKTETFVQHGPLLSKFPTSIQHYD